MSPRWSLPFVSVGVAMYAPCAGTATPQRVKRWRSRRARHARGTCHRASVLDHQSRVVHRQMRTEVAVIGAAHEDEIRLVADPQSPESISPTEDLGRGGGEGVQSLKRSHPV